MIKFKLSRENINDYYHTNGTILPIEPTKLLKHSLPDLENKEELLSLIIYQLSEQEGVTILTAKEELNYLLTMLTKEQVKKRLMDGMLHLTR